MTETPNPAPSDVSDETAPVVSDNATPADPAPAAPPATVNVTNGDVPQPAANTEDEATFKADTSDAPVAASPTTPGAPEGPSALTDASAALGAGEHAVSDAQHGDVLGLVRDIHRMVSEMHSLVNEVKPVFDQFTTELRTKGVGGLFSAMLGGGLGGGRR